MTSFTIIIAVLIGVTLGASIDSKNKLLVFMIDGCRWDYFSRTPGADTNAGFQIIKEKGVIVEYVQSIFPSLSYPSWTTIATGTSI
jgi:predicted AlkP superfamily pyrophosphatase or phosphodiesterase